MTRRLKVDGEFVERGNLRPHVNRGRKELPEFGLELGLGGKASVHPAEIIPFARLALGRAEDRERFMEHLETIDELPEPHVLFGSPLSHAISSRDPNIVRAVLKKGAPTEPQPDRCGALATAARKGALEVLDVLLEAGASSAPCPHCGRSPLHWAAWHGGPELVRRFLAAGCDPQHRDGGGHTPQEIADINLNDEAAEILAGTRI